MTTIKPLLPQSMAPSASNKQSWRAKIKQLISEQSFLTGSALLLVSMTVVNAGNYLFNLILGRWLGPAAFADVSLIVTLFLVITLMTATLQTVATKFSATFAANNDSIRMASLRRWLGRWAWGLGGAILAFFVIGAPYLKEFFHTESVWPFVLMGIGLPLYLAQGIDRGLLQGQMRFGFLAVSYQVEMWVRLLASLALVATGWAVNGAVCGITLSLVAAWLVARRVRLDLPHITTVTGLDRSKIWAFTGPASAALIGQILINNSDILIVKHFFVPQEAGQYAALALIGRVVFFATWSVVAVMFPIVAQKYEKGERHRHLLFIALGIVGLASAGIIGLTLVAPDLIINLLFGPAYLSVAPLLWLYAIATMLYALANVLINYRLSLGNGGGSILAVLAGLAQVIGLWLWHGSLIQVVMVQIYIMTVFLGTLVVWDAWLSFQQNRKHQQNQER